MRKSNDGFNLDDHNLLIEINVRLSDVIRELKEMKDNFAVKQADHELRIRRIEQLGAMAIGALALAQIVLKFLV